MKLQWTQRGRVDHELIWGSIALIVLLSAAFLPVERVMSQTGYRCPFRALTGLPCPTCAGTRTVIAMGSLRFKQGFALNPLVAVGWVCAALYVPYALFVSLSRGRRLRVTDLSVSERRVVALLFVCLGLGNWAYVILSR